MIMFNHAQTFLGDIFGTLTPEVTNRSNVALAVGDVVAFPTNFAAYTNDSGAVSRDRSSANFIWRNVDALSTGNSQMGILAVVKQPIAAGGNGLVSVFDPDIQLLCVGGSGVTEAAGHFLFPNNVIGTPSATAKTLSAHIITNLDALTIPTRCYGFTNEAAPDTTAALKYCFFVGCGYFNAGGGA
jgi:hypothetical protein